MGYVVTAPLVQVLRAGGGYVTVHEGAALPEDADPDHVALLVEGGMVGDAPTSDGEAKPKRGRTSSKATAEGE